MKDLKTRALRGAATSSPRAYTDDYGDDIPGKGNIAFDKQHFDTVVHGFRHHKMVRQGLKDMYKENAEEIRYLAKINRQIYNDLYKTSKGR